MMRDSGLQNCSMDQKENWNIRTQWLQTQFEFEKHVVQVQELSNLSVFGMIEDRRGEQMWLLHNKWRALKGVPSK